MKYKSHILGAALALALCAGTAHADPKNGFSVNGGLVSSSMNGTFTTGFLTGLPVTYTSSGISLGLDYQIALNDNFSLNPFLMTSGEGTTGLGNNVGANHGILGLQLRYWVGDAFLGAHIGHYSETLNYNNIGISTNASGGGVGLVAGWENPAGGLYVMGQLDSATINYANANTKLGAFRLSVGYRWK